MANCQKQFNEYNEYLNLTRSKRDVMNKSRESSRDKVKKHFKENHPGYTPTFWIQGSKKNGTNIRTEDESCDQDDGIYFDRDPEDSVSGTTLQGWVHDAVKNDTKQGAEWRKKCIRKKYKENSMGTFHFDYPVYYNTDDMLHPLLAVRGEDLEESDPQEFAQWFDKQKDEDGQLVRIIKYLKGWCSYKGKSHKMPNGLAMTILACDHMMYDERDDQCLSDTLKAIRSQLQLRWACVMPTTPCDDLFARHDQGFRDRFLDAIDSFIDAAERALNEDSKPKATRLWKQHLGTRFPLASEEHQNGSSARGSQASLAAVVGRNKPYNSGQ